MSECDLEAMRERRAWFSPSEWKFGWDSQGRHISHCLVGSFWQYRHESDDEIRSRIDAALAAR